MSRLSVRSLVAMLVAMLAILGTLLVFAAGRLGLDAPLLLRGGRFAEVDPLLQAQWSTADALLGARQLRLLQLLRAFALHQAGRAVDARSHLDAAGPDIATEAKLMRQSWSELARFVADLSEYRRTAL